MLGAEDTKINTVTNSSLREGRYANNYMAVIL